MEPKKTALSKHHIYNLKTVIINALFKGVDMLIFARCFQVGVCVNSFHFRGV